MSPTPRRVAPAPRLGAAVPLLIALAALGAAAPAAPPRVPAATPVGIVSPAAGRTVVLCSLSDVKGATLPCGCQIPKGGLARQATFVDSMRAVEPRTFLVDAGGFSPEKDERRDVVGFLMESMVRMGFDAVGVGDRDLRFGLPYLLAQARRTHLPLVSANLVDRRTGRPVLPTSVVILRSGVRVGIFSLIGDRVDLGPSRDSLTALDPVATAARVVPELRRKGANVVVALAGLGRGGSEALCKAVPGIDVAIAAREVPMIRSGSVVGGALVVCGGEQGEHIGHAVLTLGNDGRVATRRSDIVVLGPEIRSRPDLRTAVDAFESGLAEKTLDARRAQAEGMSGPDHFVGMEVCARCHPDETAQWKTTAHARAWQAVADSGRSADLTCVGCHVVGNRQPGGFLGARMTPARLNVQCESCHGMGTLHEAFAQPPRAVTEATCRGCHDATNSPGFSFAAYRARILHRPPASPGTTPAGGSGTRR